MRDKITKLVNVYKKYGLRGFIKKLYAYVVANYLNKISPAVFFSKRKYTNMLKSVLEEEKYERVILWRSSFGYNVELFQRPQHIANNLAKKGCLVFYEVTTMTDKIKTFKKLKDNLYLVNFNNIALNKIFTTVLDEVEKPKYIELYSTDWKLSVQNIEDYLARGYKLIYEYIDDLSPELAGTKDIPKNIIDKYEYVMNNESVYVVVTAKALEENVRKRRNAKLAVSSNGVDYEFYKTFDEDYEFEAEFEDILKLGKPIVCYYGALAKWFDYELIKKIDETDLYSIVLFGIKYDDSYEESGIGNLANVYFMGPRDYKVLKNYARKADVLMIPFKINNITKATSPVKIFEYMALQKPIVTTDMPECRKYKSVMIGHNHEEFIELLDTALDKVRDEKYLKIERKEAQENDWSGKAQDIIDLIKKDER